ncbi:MAG: hypothetical protein SOW59_08560 [Corynebacterium sp.]|nr:hypothetical protein [Corynebacterium sp.]
MTLTPRQRFVLNNAIASNAMETGTIDHEFTPTLEKIMDGTLSVDDVIATITQEHTTHDER